MRALNFAASLAVSSIRQTFLQDSSSRILIWVAAGREEEGRSGQQQQQEEGQLAANKGQQPAEAGWHRTS